jgi:FkbM family methyltransferase
MRSTTNIENLIENASYDIHNPRYNFNVAVEYELLGQTGAAAGFYLRAAEYGYSSDPLIAYSSLLRMAVCFEGQNNRDHTVSNCLLQAIAFMPTRPEAYFLYARFHERATNWSEAYTNAEVGLLFADNVMESLPVTVDYPGKYALLFEKAVAGWWVGRKLEAVEILKDLYNNYSLTPEYKNIIASNLIRIGETLTINKDIDPLEPVVSNYRKYFGIQASMIIDIGTRDGEDANYLAKALNSFKVIAIDANPVGVELTKSLHPWMSVHYGAVSDSDGETEFYQVVDDNVELMGCSSMADKEQTMFKSDFEGKVHKIKVPMMRMDTFLASQGITEDIDVVKIDTEGFSWQVLQGFGDRLQSVRILHVETERETKHPNHVLSDGITKFMEEQGFILVDKSYEWGWGIEDQIWVNKRLAWRHTYALE